ncbi:exodeoxyribonuclease VII small subunit [Desulfohalobium retbaense]|jgi:exodeoxyribonuclease VII small subunit|uniref:Exodeoxyribonuclease 7 small subunit n=1 Tax=Desulfohalobium retbaense (strain ATCC 49708 / DSM 5692 / JCM 16813 / HR100) TaxID=485915 RepID=C8X3P7_DESRD|nr:exodeoxyribonuclease VII small subunit [Desulfohalobium retbaense]ACV69044.1 Exonuclease VII small subunit [Desulfohalobium retbaense DSM 5692]
MTTASTESDQAQWDFEQRLERLQAIVSRLEEENVPLEEGVALFKEGSELAQQCRRQLQEAKHQVEIYAQGVLEEFDPEQGGGGGDAETAS